MENNKNNITIWKQNLLLFELYNLFKKGDKSNFGEIKKLIKISINYWEGIIQSIKFCVKKKINCVFIIDQYKEELDKEFINLKNLKEIIEDKDNNFVKLLISSSINHKDIRNFLLLKYLNVGIPSIIDYEYIDELFNIEEIPNYLQDFSDSQKNLYMENFKGMSTYYFHISEFKEEEKNISSMNNIKKKEEEKINMQIEEFYKNTVIHFDKFNLLFKSYSLFGTNQLQNVEIRNLIEIIPLKYFKLHVCNDTILDISFLFPLAKKCFLNFLNKKIFELLKCPNYPFPGRTIGDLLEIQIIECLKNNTFDKFEQFCIVDEIWNPKKINYINKETIKKDTIFITQTNTNGEYVDFAFLVKGEILILCQCKKALNKEPKNYITIKKLDEHKNVIQSNIEKIFETNISKIYLFYITGIHMIDREKNKFIPWFNEKDKFSVLKKIVKQSNIRLIYFDVINSKIFFRLHKKFYEFENICGETSPIINNVSFINLNGVDYRVSNTLDAIRNNINTINNNLIDQLGNKSKIIELNKIERDLYESSLDEKIADYAIKINNFEKIKGKNMLFYTPNLAIKFKIGRINYISKFNNNKSKIEFFTNENGCIHEVNSIDDDDINNINSFSLINLLGKKTSSSSK